MYKLLLCWRYLKTRYLAFACIISVMLGVATLIVVNSVMNGFSSKLRNLLHCVMSDVVVEANGFEGFTDPADKMDKIRKIPYLGEQIEAMAATLEAFAMVQYRHPNGEMATRPVRVLGININARAKVGGFQEHLGSFMKHEKDNKDHPSANLKMPVASFEIPEDIRRAHEQSEKFLQEQREEKTVVAQSNPARTAAMGFLWAYVEQQRANVASDEIPPPTPVPFIPRIPQGAIVGHLIAHFNYRDPDTGEIKEAESIRKGDKIVLTTVSGQRLTPVYDSFVVVDYFRSEMSDFDGNCIFVPLEHLQSLRTMENRATSILLKLKDYSEAEKVCKSLAKLFPNERLNINTWEEKQGPLLRAIEIEKRILNVLLFMIIAVAGFGILSIFTMIVSEKTRDIGILKALGASNGGVMKIFLAYGLLLGILGAGFGTILGLSITYNINEVERLLSLLTGSKVFTGEVYYFQSIPTDVQPVAVFLVNVGAVIIAIVFSILPALRAAMLHPVQALRYE